MKGPGGRAATWVGRVAAVTMLGLVGSCGAHVAYADRAPVESGNVRSVPSMGYSSNDDTQLREVRMPLSDGRTVTCVVYGGYKQGGLSCDWQGATR